MIGRVVPVVIFLLLGALLTYGLKVADHKEDLPSPLIGKPMPPFTLPLLYEQDVLVDSGELIGKPMLVNFWASWCVTCRYEHPVIEELARRNVIRIVGMNFRDEEGDARAWLARFGDPYSMIIQDRNGRTSIDFGVYAAPESFLVDENGIIVFKQLGALTPEVIEEEILPRIAHTGSSARR